MVRTFRALVEFTYWVRRDVVDEPTLTKIRDALNRFHHYREIFRDTKVRPEGFGNLPRQQSLVHYPYVIEQFASCTGLCTSITENLHIRAVKKPYRRSNRNEPLGQMLLTNQRLSSLAAARSDFKMRGLLEKTVLADTMRRLAVNGASENNISVDGPAGDTGTVGQEDEDDNGAPDEALDETEVAEEGDEDGPVAGPRVENEVVLARTPRELLLFESH